MRILRSYPTILANPCQARTADERDAALSGISLAIFATHLIAALVAALAIVLITLCVALASQREIRDLASSLVATHPVYTLAGLYALQSHDPKIWAPQALPALGHW